MADNKKSFLLYADFIHTFNELTDEESGKLIKIILSYVNDENPIIEDKLIRIAFEPIKQQLKRDLKHWESIKEKRSKAGLTSAKNKQHKATKSTHVESVEQIQHKATKSTVTVNVNDNVTVTSNNTPNGVVVATLPTDDTQKILLSKWDEILKSFEGKSIKDIRIMIEDFIKSEKPKFIDPYMNYWNILADYLKLAKVQACTDARKNKFKVRINEPAFDFIRILEKIRCSPMLKGETSNWRVSFDWIFENQSNYVKILEGTYDA